MSPALSVWLDLSRIVAAWCVFMGHAVGLHVAPVGLSGQWHRSADDAVTAFFIISGLVIAYTSERRAHEGWRGYAVARLSRVYSVAIPALLFAVAVDLVGMRINAAPYVPEWQYPRLWLYLPLHWAFLGETWLGAFYPFTVAPYWSLVYEVWYYAFFGCAVFLRGWPRWLGMLLVGLLMGPRIWLLAPVWWLGVRLHRWVPRHALSPVWARSLMGLSALLYALYIGTGMQAGTDGASKELYAWMATVLPFPFHAGSTVHVLSDYVMAALFALFVWGAAWSRWALPNDWARGVQRVAGYTFTFYLLHYTLLTLALACGLERVSGWTLLAIQLGVMAVTVLHAQVGEQRRAAYARVIDRLLPGRRRGLGMTRA